MLVLPGTSTASAVRRTEMHIAILVPRGAAKGHGLLRILAAILAGGIFCGCAARGPRFTPKMPTPERAIAYVYRPSDSYATHDGPIYGAQDIYVNGKHVGDLNRVGYLAV